MSQHPSSSARWAIGRFLPLALEQETLADRLEPIVGVPERAVDRGSQALAEKYNIIYIHTYIILNIYYNILQYSYIHIYICDNGDRRRKVEKSQSDDSGNGEATKVTIRIITKPGNKN